MTPDEFDKMLHDADVKLARLRALYEQYFQGIERLEPHVARKDLDRTFELLRKSQPRNTALRFRMQQSFARYGTYQTYWQRIGRQIEEGTYKRDIARVKKKHADAAARPEASAWEIDVDIDEVDTGLSLDETDVDAILGALGAGREKSLRPTGVSAPEPVASLAPAAKVATPSLMRGLSPFASFGKPTMSRPGAAAPRDADGVKPAATSPTPGAAARPAVNAAISAAKSAAAPIVAASPSPAAPTAGGARSLSPLTSFGRPVEPKVAPTAFSAAPRPLAPNAAAPARPLAPNAAAPRPLAPNAVAPNAAAPRPLAPNAAAPRPLAPNAVAPNAVAPVAPTPAGPPAVARPPAAAAAPARAPSAPGSAANGGMDERTMRAVYDRYADARKKNNEGEIRFEALAQSVEKMLPKLREKHGGKKIDFDVVVTNGRVGLKPKVGE